MINQSKHSFQIPSCMKRQDGRGSCFFIFMLVSCFASRTQGACACLYAIVLGSLVKSVELNLGREKT